VSRWRIGRVTEVFSPGFCYRNDALRNLGEDSFRDRKQRGTAKQNAE